MVVLKTAHTKNAPLKAAATIKKIFLGPKD